MAKIAPVSTKYLVIAEIKAEGTVTKPDVIGAVFGQTEGLLGSELELRELQKSGRIGRIDVELNVKDGKTSGEIILPSSLDKTKTAIVAAALETIDRVGPCDAKISIKEMRDMRVIKRDYVADRAKELLRKFVGDSMPDSVELTEDVKSSVRAMDVIEYGADRLPAGPAVESSDEIIVVEGRADVLALLKSGFNNAVALQGTNVPKTIIELSKKKKIILFIDGDRGGDLILQELNSVAKVDSVARAPDGKEVEELTQKEIHQALRAAIPVGEYIPKNKHSLRTSSSAPRRELRRMPVRRTIRQTSERVRMNPNTAKILKEMVSGMTGTKGANILDEKLNILGKVPVTELDATLANLDGAYAVVFDGEANDRIVSSARRKRVRFLVAT
ncbi:MAG: DNA primase DnaG, partial [Candidatus Nanoarchaeia archaeon]|nr:DNA primase DnaG [Candidatus Nanoarchaeia archaeon]